MAYPRPIASHRAPLSRRVLALAVGGVLAVGLVSGAVSAAAGTAVADAVADGADASAASIATQLPRPQTVTELPVPEQTAVAAAAHEPTACDHDGVAAALAKHDSHAVIAAMGGGAAFRDAVASGNAPCIHLDDPEAVWVVVNKQRAFNPKDWAPKDLADLGSVRDGAGLILRQEAAGALVELADGTASAGAGTLGAFSAYRSYGMQVDVYAQIASAEGASQADRSSARAGHSEHQTGLTADVVACDWSCGTIEAIEGTPQAQYLVDHGWEYGWIVRYEAGYEGVSGYMPEPWHVRYVGKELAKAYHEGGFHTLEEFFGLPAAPDYVG